jgi:hypothetical protein
VRAKELKRCLSSQAHVFSGSDESEANKLTLKPYPELFSQPDESKRAEKMLELVIHKSKAKERKRCLSSPCPKSFQAWMSVRRLKSQLSTYPRLLHGLDESQIALALSWSCSTPDETTQPTRLTKI